MATEHLCTVGAEMIANKHKTQRMGAELEFLHRYHVSKGEDFLDKLLTGDERRVQYENVETKEQSKQCKHISPQADR